MPKSLAGVHRSVLIRTRVTEEVAARIDEAAATLGKSRSEVVRDTLTERFDTTTEESER